MAAAHADHFAKHSAAFTHYARCLNACKASGNGTDVCFSQCLVQPTLPHARLANSGCRQIRAASQCTAQPYCDWVDGVGCGRKQIHADGSVSVFYDIADPAVITMTSEGVKLEQ